MNPYDRNATPCQLMCKNVPQNHMGFKVSKEHLKALAPYYDVLRLKT